MTTDKKTCDTKVDFNVRHLRVALFYHAQNTSNTIKQVTPIPDLTGLRGTDCYQAVRVSLYKNVKQSPKDPKLQHKEPKPRTFKHNPTLLAIYVLSTRFYKLQKETLFIASAVF